MSISLEGVVQRGHRYAIVDEVDSILIDEARTPLIISGEPTTAAKTYYDFARIVEGPRRRAVEGHEARGRGARSSEHDYLYDEKHKTVSPTESGIEKVERALKIEQPLQPEQRPARQPPDPGAEGARRSTSATSTTSSRTAR